MGFDKARIVNIQSLHGEYFCPVCRQLVYPNEALQSQCTHLFCKPCLAHVAGTSRACPYCGCLVKADSKGVHSQTQQTEGVRNAAAASSSNPQQTQTANQPGAPNSQAQTSQTAAAMKFLRISI